VLFDILVFFVYFSHGDLFFNILLKVFVSYMLLNVYNFLSTHVFNCVLFVCVSVIYFNKKP
jgi:hypothetical protein